MTRWEGKTNESYKRCGMGPCANGVKCVVEWNG